MRSSVRWLPGLAAGLGGFAAGALTGTYRQSLAQSQARVRSGSRLALTNEGPVEFGLAGTGAPLLVLHGIGGGYDQGLLIGAAFSDLQVIAPSRLGYLRTPLRPDSSPAAQARVHLALLDRLGIERVLVLGASAGAPSAINLALRWPARVRGLILLSPRAYVPGHIVKPPATLSNQVLSSLILSGSDFGYWCALRAARTQLMALIGGIPRELLRGLSPAKRQRVALFTEIVLPLSLRIAGIRNDAATVLEPLPLQQITAPTLAVAAKDDLFETAPAADFVASQIPGAELILLDRGGHLFADRQREVEASVADFLARCD